MMPDCIEEEFYIDRGLNGTVDGKMAFPEIYKLLGFIGHEFKTQIISLFRITKPYGIFYSRSSIE